MPSKVTDATKTAPFHLFFWKSDCAAGNASGRASEGQQAVATQAE